MVQTLQWLLLVLLVLLMRRMRMHCQTLTWAWLFRVVHRNVFEVHALILLVAFR